MYAILRKKIGGKIMAKYTTVIFDLDGTLLNTLKDLTDCVNYALMKHNQPSRTMDEVRSFVGNGIRLLMERAVIDGAENPKFNEMYEDFKAYYRIHCLDATVPYPGIMELLEDLKQKDYKMAIVSNKLDPAVKDLNNQFFADYMADAVGETETIRKKPAPDMVEQVLKNLNSNKKETLYVGDSEVDIQTAKNAGIDVVSVSWGFKDLKFLMEHGAQVIVDEPEAVVNYLEACNANETE